MLDGRRRPEGRFFIGMLSMLLVRLRETSLREREQLPASC
jgi:hypothetical protein